MRFYTAACRVRVIRQKDSPWKIRAHPILSVSFVCVCVCFFTYFVRWQRLFHGKFNNLARVSENAEEN